MRIAVAGGTGAVGRHVVASLAAAGHEPIVLTRSAGVDVLSKAGLADALSGASAVIDVSSVASTSARESVRFFGTVTKNLLEAEEQAGVGHHVALSIVGAAAVNAAYYAGKKTQEDLVKASGSRWTLLRATQFHEFAAQMLQHGAVGPVQIVPSMLSQPIAAAEVGAVLAEIAVGAPRGREPDLAGPKVERMADLVRRYLRAQGSGRPVLQVPLPGAWGRSMRDGTLLPGQGARLGTQDFTSWLAEQPRA
jgi:uncharacterized protein YbjT (DUF2867 family)